MSSAAEKISFHVRSAFWLDLAVKAALVPLLAFGAFSGLERFAGKAFGWRLVGYSIAALIVPAIWAPHGRRSAYPFAADISSSCRFSSTRSATRSTSTRKPLRELVAPQRSAWRGTGAHQIRGAELLGLVVGFGGVTAILWEIGEYFAFIRIRRSSRRPTRTRSVT